MSHHPLILQMIAAERQTDLLKEADAYRRYRQPRRLRNDRTGRLKEIVARFRGLQKRAARSIAQERSFLTRKIAGLHFGR